MPRNENPKDLTLKLPADIAANAPSRPNSSPIALQGIDLSSIEGSFPLSSLPPLPASPPPPPTSPGQHQHQHHHHHFHHQQQQIHNNNSNNPNKDPTKSLVGNLRRDKSRERLYQPDQAGQARLMKEEDHSLHPGSGSMSQVYHLRKAPSSTPELSLVGSAESVTKGTIEAPPQPPQRIQPSPHHSEDGITSKRKEKHFRNPLNRSKSIRRDSNSSKSKPDGFDFTEQPPKTAPLSTDWPGSEMLKAKGKERDNRRGKSAERAGRLGNDDYYQQPTEPTNRQVMPPPQQYMPSREKERNIFLSGGKNAFSKAKTGGGNFLNRIGKIGRSGSSHEKEPLPQQHEEAYVLKIINLPLVEQTRVTRISKSLDACKDKTEYWMPSLPWRCIDYLNSNCESEGLYRVPGSGPQIKQWQRRFDTEQDIDLLDEQELYDPNNISSLLKQWLRELPTEIFPADLQASLGIELEKDNPDYTKMGQPAPQKLRDALSELSPFNYYLLFAITCHLSLLVSHQEQNRMDLNNLAICIGPCLKMERWLFNYLVGDWRRCWQGCWTEKQALEVERKFEDPDYVAENEYLPPSRGEPEDRAVSSGGESTPAEDARDERQRPSTSASSRLRGSRDNSGTRSSSSSRRPPQSRNENTKPSTYIPAGMSPAQQAQPFSNGNLAVNDRRPTTSSDVRRPATSDSRKQNDPDTFSPTPSSAVSTISAGPPRLQLHNRSQSDIPTSPILPPGSG